MIAVPSPPQNAIAAWPSFAPSSGTTRASGHCARPDTFPATGQGSDSHDPTPGRRQQCAREDHRRSCSTTSRLLTAATRLPPRRLEAAGHDLRSLALLMRWHDITPLALNRKKTAGSKQPKPLARSLPAEVFKHSPRANHSLHSNAVGCAGCEYHARCRVNPEPWREARGSRAGALVPFMGVYEGVREEFEAAAIKPLFRRQQQSPPVVDAMEAFDVEPGAVACVAGRAGTLVGANATEDAAFFVVAAHLAPPS